MPLGADPIGLAQRDAVDPFHGQHPPGRELGVGARHADPRIGLEIPGELLHVAQLAPVVQFPAHRPLKLRHRRAGAIVSELGQAFGQQGQPGQDLQVHLHLPLDPRPLDLHHRRLPGEERRPVNLADRGRRHRHVLEGGEYLFDRVAQFRLDQGSCLLRRVGRHVGLKLFEFLGQRDADQVGPHAEDLPQLDERRPQLDQGHFDPGFPTVPGDRRSVGRFEQVLGELRPEPADPVGQLILAQNRQYLPPTIQVPVDLRNRRDFHGRIPADESGERKGSLPAM